MNKNENNLELLMQRLAKNGVTTIQELAESCGQNEEFPEEIIKQLKLSNPFLGERQNFQDLINQAVLRRHK